MGCCRWEEKGKVSGGLVRGSFLGGLAFELPFQDEEDSIGTEGGGGHPRRKRGPSGSPEAG